MNRQARLGAIPVIVFEIAGTILTAYLTYKMSAGAAVAKAAKDHEEFKRLQEEFLGQIALELGRKTDIPYWTWYNILRWVQNTGTEPGPGDVPHLPPPRVSTNTWLIIGGFAIVAIMIARR